MKSVPRSPNREHPLAPSCRGKASGPPAPRILIGQTTSAPRPPLSGIGWVGCEKAQRRLCNPSLDGASRVYRYPSGRGATGVPLPRPTPTRLTARCSRGLPRADKALHYAIESPIQHCLIRHGFPSAIKIPGQNAKAGVLPWDCPGWHLRYAWAR